ncbi:LysR family transcriptional regulator [Palleronia sediminis]|uniref:LysR family transcriptional regulator n=1 Tax=Palleronia sediminis TaxID=2547833 RepID=A0A4R6AB07_9RHOB|nr:LysR substrate-binding domain-containing protein [Palleronia sediminis]TDL78303.1 LysR family transcriptional regulator [Palleronia sediminis]
MYVVSNEAMLTVHLVAEFGSFSLAAARLNKVPSAVSYSVRKIEEQLGVKLFERRHREVVLTPAGEFFVQKSHFILRDIEELRRKTQMVGSGVDTVFRVSINNIMKRECVSDFARSFCARFPTTELRMQTDVYNGCWDVLDRREADFVIGAPHAAPDPEGLMIDEIGTVNWDFVTGRDHPLAGVTHPLSNDELREHTAIVVQDTSVGLSPSLAWLLDGQNAIYAPDLHILIRLVKQGAGVAFVPHHKVAYELDHGDLIKKAVVEHKVGTRVSYAWRTNPQSVVLQWVVEYLGDPSIRQSWISSSNEPA